MKNYAVDARDRRLMAELCRNARLTNAELGERVGMSPSNCFRRTRSLEDAGLIRGYVAVLDARKLGLGLAAYLLVNLDQRTETDAMSFFDFVQSEPRIVECAAITGSSDVIIKVLVSDIEALGEFTLHHLLKLPSIKSVTSCVVIQMVKEGHSLSVSASADF